MTPEQTQKFNEMYQYFQARKQQQISFPLDVNSKGIVRKNIPVFVRSTGSTITESMRIYINIDGVEYQVNCKPS